jgi:hypothetical protein
MVDFLRPWVVNLTGFSTLKAKDLKKSIPTKAMNLMQGLFYKTKFRLRFFLGTEFCLVSSIEIVAPALYA